MMSKMTVKSLGSLRCLAGMAGLLALSGCAEYHLTIPSSDPNQPEGQAGAYQTETMNAYAWGLLLDPEVVGADKCRDGINDVFVDRNFGQDLASVVTLGLWMPAEVRYRCKAPGTRGGVFPTEPTQPSQ
jgi:hypothetical protein